MAGKIVSRLRSIDVMLTIDRAQTQYSLPGWPLLHIAQSGGSPSGMARASINGMFD